MTDDKRRWREWACGMQLADNALAAASISRNKEKGETVKERERKRQRQRERRRERDREGERARRGDTSEPGEVSARGWERGKLKAQHRDSVRTSRRNT